MFFYRTGNHHAFIPYTLLSDAKTPSSTEGQAWSRPLAIIKPPWLQPSVVNLPSTAGLLSQPRRGQVTAFTLIITQGNESALRVTGLNQRRRRLIPPRLLSHKPRLALNWVSLKWWLCFRRPAGRTPQPPCCFTKLNTEVSSPPVYQCGQTGFGFGHSLAAKAVFIFHCTGNSQ